MYIKGSILDYKRRELTVTNIGGTDYACNFGCNRDQICLQSRKLKHLETDLLGSISYLKKFEIAGIYGPYRN